MNGYAVLKGASYTLAVTPDMVTVSYTHLDVYKRQGSDWYVQREPRR